MISQSASCSLLFTESTEDMRCGAFLEGTLARFPVEGDLGTEHLTTSDGIVLADVLKVMGSQLLAPSDLDVRDGPTQACGTGVSVQDRITGDFIHIRGDAPELAGTKSVDFWFRPIEVLDDAEMAALVSKDALNANNGDLLVTMFSEGTEHYVLMRIEHEEGEWVACSQAVALDTWHHVAASVDTTGAKLFVDGVLADNTAPTLNVDVASACSDPDAQSLAKMSDLAVNQNDWLWGANNDRSPTTNPARSVREMVLDELRFRDRVFTAKEARAAYRAVVGN